MALGDLGGFFHGDPRALSFRRDVDAVTQSLLHGGEARRLQGLVGLRAGQAAQAATGNVASSPALAARQGGQTAASAALEAGIQSARMAQDAKTQGAQMAQQRIDRERARIGNAVGAGLGLAGTVAAGLIPGGQAAPAMSLAQAGLGQLQGPSRPPSGNAPPQAARSPLQASTMPPVPMGAGRALGNPAVGLGRALGNPAVQPPMQNAPQPPRGGAPGVFGPQIDPDEFLQNLMGAFGSIPGLGGR